MIKYNHGILSEALTNRQDHINQILQGIPRLMTEEKNLALMQPISLQEVELVVMGMPKNKAPEPDGFTTDFHQACWSFLGQEIYEIV